jgi:anti-sigma B factor antagonist
VPTTDFEAHDGLLTVQQTSNRSQLRVSLQGEMDLSNHQIAESVLREALASGMAVVVDLAKLEFIDSTGLAMLVRAIAESGDGRLSFVPSEHEAVRRLFSLTGLDERMRFVPAAEVVAVPEESDRLLAGDAEPLLPAG